MAPNPEQKVLVVLDAGIATEPNLKLLKSRGYNYLYVSRNRPQDCRLEADGESVTVYDSRRRSITTEGENPYGVTVEMKLCSDTTESTAEIYRALGYKSMPFRKYTI